MDIYISGSLFQRPFTDSDIILLRSDSVNLIVFFFFIFFDLFLSVFINFSYISILRKEKRTHYGCGFSVSMYIIPLFIELCYVAYNLKFKTLPEIVYIPTILNF